MSSQKLLCSFFLISLYTLVHADCDVYKKTMDSIGFWHSYDFSQGMAPSIPHLYADGAKVTASTSGGTVTMPPEEFFAAFDLKITKMNINVRDIDCAADGFWCHLKVWTSYWNPSNETVSIPQYWTYLYDPVTCKWSHYVILTHSNDLDYMVDVLTDSASGLVADESLDSEADAGEDEL